MWIGFLVLKFNAKMQWIILVSFSSWFQLAYVWQNLNRAHPTIITLYSHFHKSRQTFRSKSFRIYGKPEPIWNALILMKNQINKLDTDNNAQFYYY